MSYTFIYVIQNLIAEYLLQINVDFQTMGNQRHKRKSGEASNSDGDDSKQGPESSVKVVKPVVEPTQDLVPERRRIWGKKQSVKEVAW